MAMTIRNAVPEDELSIVVLWRSCDLVASYNDPGADFRFAMQGSSSAVLVAEDDEVGVTGSVMVGHDGHRGWLYYLATAPDARGQGVGRAMVEAGERWLSARAVRKVQLMVRRTNKGVVSFYKHLGYEDTPRVIMAKWLAEPE